MLICDLPDAVTTDDNDVIDDVTDRPSGLVVSIVTSHCEWPRNVLHPVDLRRRRTTRTRNLPHEDRGDSRSAMPIDYPVDFTVCVPPIFGNVSVTELVEFIEVNCAQDQNLL